MFDTLYSYLYILMWPYIYKIPDVACHRSLYKPDHCMSENNLWCCDRPVNHHAKSNMFKLDHYIHYILIPFRQGFDIKYDHDGPRPGGRHSHICQVQACAAVKTPPPFT